MRSMDFARRHLPYVLPFMDDLLPYIERFVRFPQAFLPLVGFRAETRQSGADLELFSVRGMLPGIEECRCPRWIPWMAS